MDSANILQVRYGAEDLVSRVPGLFPWFEYGEDGVTRLRSARDSENGCYGKVACGLTLPEGGEDGEGSVSLEVGGNTILEAGGSYSYRTLMNEYYRYRDSLDRDDPFLFFMDTCIGRYQIWDDPNLPEGLDLSVCDLVPEYGYYAESARLFGEYCSMSYMCHAYELMRSDMGEVNCELECLLDRYARMGGDLMRDYYQSKSVEAGPIADMILEQYAAPEAETFDIGVSFVSSSEDLGVLSAWLVPWEPGVRYVGGDIVTHGGRTWVCTCQEGEWTEGLWDPATETLVFDTRNFEMLTCSDYTHGMGDEWTVGGFAASQLTMFKDGLTFTDEGGTARIPQPDEDWLWYYKVGAVSGAETETDSIGNITVKDGETRVTTVGEYETNLNAYGNVLVSVTADPDAMSVTFGYVVGANLKARLADTVTDQLGDTRYYYSGYEYNEADPHGVVWTETYAFSGDTSEICEIIQNGGFETYVNGWPTQYRYCRCPFSTLEATRDIRMMVNGAPVTSRVVMGRYSASVRNEKDILVSPVFSDGSLIGVPFEPHVESDVFVNRGDSAAWERHMKLGECRSFDDLETYANGGFFNMISQ